MVRAAGSLHGQWEPGYARLHNPQCNTYSQGELSKCSAVERIECYRPDTDQTQCSEKRCHCLLVSKCRDKYRITCLNRRNKINKKRFNISALSSWVWKKYMFYFSCELGFLKFSVLQKTCFTAKFRWKGGYRSQQRQESEFQSRAHWKRSKTHHSEQINCIYCYWE